MEKNLRALKRLIYGCFVAGALGVALCYLISFNTGSVDAAGIAAFAAIAIVGCCCSLILKILSLIDTRLSRIEMPVSDSQLERSVKRIGLRPRSESMRPRDWFGIIIRATGVWLLTQGALYGFLALIKLAGVETTTPSLMTEDKLLAAFYFVTGLLLILLTEKIVQLIYEPKSDVDRLDAEHNPSTES